MHSLGVLDIPLTELAKVTGGDFWGQARNAWDGVWTAAGNARRAATDYYLGTVTSWQQAAGTLKPATPDFTFGGPRG